MNCKSENEGFEGIHLPLQKMMLKSRIWGLLETGDDEKNSL